MSRHSFFPFYRLFSFPFSYFKSNFPRFSDGTSLFSPPKLTFSLLHLVLPHASGTSSRDLTLYYRHTSLFAQREGFFISCFPFSPSSSPSFSIDFLSALHSPPPSSLLPHFLSLSSPLFHSPPQLTHERAHPRALRAHAYDRAHARPSGGFRLLPSPLHTPITIHCASMR